MTCNSAETKQTPKASSLFRMIHRGNPQHCTLFCRRRFTVDANSHVPSHIWMTAGQDVCIACLDGRMQKAGENWTLVNVAWVEIYCGLRTVLYFCEYSRAWESAPDTDTCAQIPLGLLKGRKWRDHFTKGAMAVPMHTVQWYCTGFSKANGQYIL